MVARTGKPIISTHDLTKHFWVARQGPGALGAMRSLVDRSGKTVEAVAGISFEIQAGEMVGYLGPNGAGKSTTIKMLTGILVPTSGEATVDGHIPWKQRKELARQIGVVFGQRTQLWWDLPLIESLELLGHIYRVPSDRFRTQLDVLVDLLSLDEFLHTPVRQLSLGQRMRGDLAAALIHEPSILYLDEPTIGLDVVAKARVRDFLLRINQEHGVTILLTTHDLGDVEYLCQRLLIIDHGRLIFDGPLDDIRRRYGSQRTLVVDLTPTNQAFTLSSHVVDGARLLASDGIRHRIEFDRIKVNPADLIATIAACHEIVDVQIEEPDIESIVRRIYTEGV
jgi:ABC-2 type transport system ATP-binding protein